MITLIVERAGRREVYPFTGESISIGRADDNDLRVTSKFVSQNHCRIEVGEEFGARLVDLNSQNGTLVNGADVSQCRLKPGDRIEVGSLLLWFERAPDETTAALDVDADEVTDAGDEDFQISARAGTGTSSQLRESLQDLMVAFRKSFGDERGLAEVEQAILASTRSVFPRPAFERSLEAARLIEVTRLINSSTDLDRVLRMIMDAAVDMTDSERGFLVLREENGQWKVRVARNFDHEQVRGAEHKISRSIAQQVAKTGKPICCVNAQDDQRFVSFASVMELKLRSVICLPLRVRDDVIGTIYLDNRFKDGVYTQRELSLLESFADHAALALENARLYQKNLENEQALVTRTQELEDLARVLDKRMDEATEANAARPKPLTRDGLTHNYSRLVGESPCMIEMFRLLDRIIESDLPVLVTGESGTGKELVAHAIHTNSNRNDKAFVRENCAAIPASLLESELFGYKKGAFTGAATDRKGLFEEADGGTIFLDEIGEMSLEMQSKLLRVLQIGEIRPVGGRDVVHVDVRLISATNKDLRVMVEGGGFREDLFFRLNVVCVEVPPLRNRIEDITLLVTLFLNEIAAKSGEAAKTIDPLAMKYLLSYHWPGNVRELQNEIQRAVALSGAAITVDDISKELTHGRALAAGVASTGGTLKDLVRMATFQKEREIILRTLEECSWGKSAAARQLGISRPTLDQKIRLFGLAPFIKRGKHP